MATTYMMNNLLVSCLMFFVMIGSLNTKPADTKAICGRAKNPSFCTSFMKANPKISGADIKMLASITFSAALTSAQIALMKFLSLATKETNPALKKGCTSCVEQYKNTISSLEEAAKSFTSGDGPGMNIKVLAAMKGPTTCQDGLAKVKADPSIAKTTLHSIIYSFENGLSLEMSNMFTCPVPSRIAAD
ncbi:Pectinesterase inhibitor 2 [Raphanus sativus]|uniref:Pectinesterase inhibitor 2-like n=1 Tax=Raphanus sativus TaxID=3726 RepID=A0A6J0JLM3_RAPSA|nr:pectinesterase inhibitor 2-like [Raphanus sativus]KAJ4888740.1 Pectinesterase inhibitor 2 [Raphanus sativus]